jgi:long-chain acyl-CoA synthetase
VAGYLLTRLDGGTLSIEEIAYALRLSGFTKPLFLEFAGYASDDEGANWFVQEASEEGEPMEALAESFLFYLDMDLHELADLAFAERRRSEAEYRTTPIDPPDYEALNPVVNIYLTGDNTRQPSERWFERMVSNARINLENIRQVIRGDTCAEVPIPLRPGSLDSPTRLPPLMDLIGHVEQVFEANSRRVFLVDSISGQSWTYGQIFEMASSIAGRLLQHGIKRGERVLVLLPNGVPLAATYFACLMAGIVIVPVNPALTAKEIGTILRLAKVSLVVFSAGTSSRLNGAVVKLTVPSLKFVRSGAAGYERETTGEGAILDLDRIERVEWGLPFSDCRQEDSFLLLFTSGTTALPKGVVHSAGSELGNAVTFNATMGFDKESRFLHLWPMAYSSGILNTLLSPFMAEGSVILANPFDARSPLGFWNTVIENKVNTLWLSPTMLAVLLAVDRDARGPAYCKEYLRAVCCGTAALPLVLKRNFEQKYGVEIYESYGLTELLLVAANSPRYPRRDKSVGTALPGVDIRVGRPEGTDDNDDIGGEILVRTPYAMAGYVDPNSGELSKLAAGSYYQTGDIGRLDADGNLFITGRKKDLIVRGGQTISPAAVREALLSCADVEDAYVVGLPHQFYGEEVGAVVKLRAGVHFAQVKGRILEHCRQELNPAAIPSVIAELASFPFGSTGKVLAKEIKNFLSAKAAVRTTGS